jgi:site-specific DNA recombinase
LGQKSDLKIELEKPTIKEVSFDKVYTILKGFSKFLKKAEPEKQKDLLHSVINKITVNAGNRPDKRSVKDIELFFDASIKDGFVLTCGTVHRTSLPRCSHEHNKSTSSDDAC